MIYRLIQQRQTSGEPNDDLLELLLQTQDEISGETLNRQQVRDQVATLLGVGHETTAAAMTWLWYALDQHPLVLQRVQDELATGLAERPPTLEDLPQLTYTRQVVDEVLRHYTPAPLVARLVLRDTEINGYPILVGSTIFVSLYHIHHYPDFWIKPEQFWPERFAAREESVKHRCAYLPFGVGPRLCLGNHFA
jgi:cytochrome P450